MIMNFPTNVKYTKEHEWIRLEGDVAYVGITDYAQEQLGDIVFVDIPTEGETLAADEVFGTIEVVKTISDLFLPVTGDILEQNEALADQPELVNQDPYGEGWLIKIKPAADADFDSLLEPVSGDLAAAAAEAVKGRAEALLGRFRAFSILPGHGATSSAAPGGGVAQRDSTIGGGATGE